MEKNISPEASQYIHRRIVIDASVLVKFFIEEKKSQVVDAIVALHEAQELTLIATPLLPFEVLNVLSKTLNDPKKVAYAYEKFQHMGISLIDPESKYIKKAIEAACHHKNVSYYDAAYHALAKDMDAIFLTADEHYYKAHCEEGNITLL